MPDTAVSRPAGALIPEAAHRQGNDPIFALHAEAVSRAESGESIVNATLGALLEDDGTLGYIPTFEDALDRVDHKAAAAYAPIAGRPAFLEAVVRDLFGDRAFADQAVAVATPGATGAIYHAVCNFVERGQAVLTTDYHWGPYDVIAEHAGRGVEVFPMFDERDRFHASAFERGLLDLLGRQGRVLTILNFPCHNPTGYSLDHDEWESVAAAVRRVGGVGPVCVFLDCAYLRYHVGDQNDWLDHVTTMLDSATVVVGWTASKSFTQYGARVGSGGRVAPRLRSARSDPRCLGLHLSRHLVQL